MKNPHETWMDDRQREPRTIRDAFRLAEEVDDQDRRDEQQLDESRGLWGSTE